MPEYIVAMREVHIQPVRVTAESPEEAIAITADGGGDFIEGGFEFSHTLDRDLWTVEEVSNAN